MLLFLIHFFHIQVKQMILSIVSSLHPVWICNCFFEGVHFLFHVVDYKIHLGRVWGFSDSSVGKESTCYAGDPSSIPGSGKSSEEGIGYPLQCAWSSLVAQLVKNLPAMRETWVRSLIWEDALERGKATHSSVLAYTVHGVTKSWTWLRLSLTHCPTWVQPAWDIQCSIFVFKCSSR